MISRSVYSAEGAITPQVEYATMVRVRMAVPALITAALLPALSAPAAAQQDTPCVTKSECDLRQDAIDMKNRRDAWDASVKRENDYALQRARLCARARADANNGRVSRTQEIMHRRHLAAEAAAAGSDGK